MECYVFNKKKLYTVHKTYEANHFQQHKVHNIAKHTKTPKHRNHGRHINNQKNFPLKEIATEHFKHSHPISAALKRLSLGTRVVP